MEAPQAAAAAASAAPSQQKTQSQPQPPPPPDRAPPLSSSEATGPPKKKHKKVKTNPYVALRACRRMGRAPRFHKGAQSLVLCPCRSNKHMSAMVARWNTAKVGQSWVGRRSGAGTGVGPLNLTFPPFPRPSCTRMTRRRSGGRRLKSGGEARCVGPTASALLSRQGGSAHVFVVHPSSVVQEGDAANPNFAPLGGRSRAAPF